MYDVTDKIYYRWLRGPQKPGAHSNCYICYYFLSGSGL